MTSLTFLPNLLKTEKIFYLYNPVLLPSKGRYDQIMVNRKQPTAHARQVTQAPSSKKTKDIQAMLDNAASLRELGMVEEAVAEYEKLFDTDCPPTKIIPGLVSCLSKTKSPHSVIRRVEDVVKEQGFDEQKIARIKFYLGVETEKGGYMDLALDLYKGAAELDSTNRQITERLEAIISRLSKKSKYDYLIYKELVTREQLQTALSLSKKMKKSVEFVLMQQFKIKKSDIGKSLSLYYGFPFKGFNPDTPVPVELIHNFKKPFLLHDLWVPMGWDSDGVEILIDDPGDLRKTGQIKGLTKSNRIRFYVGIREDIEKYINLFFDRAKEEKSVQDMQEMVDELNLIPDVSFEEEEEALMSGQEEVDESSSQVVKLVDQFIVTALRKNASDIHVEPSPINNKTQIRFRLDGVCQEYLEVPNSLAKGILSRLKIMGGLDIAERRLPHMTREHVSSGVKGWIDHYMSVLKGLYFRLTKLRLIPVEDFARLFRKTLRDLARTYNREVSFEVVGGALQVDIALMDRLREPFIHLLRNAIAHGLEPPEERESVGKPREGKLVLAAERKGDSLCLTVSDDGRGINREAIAAYLREKQSLSDEAISQMPEETFLNTMLNLDFSSADKTDEMAGRGVGMNVVAQAIEYLNGSMSIRSQASEGTRFIIELPLSLSLVYAITFKLGRYTLSVPTTQVHGIKGADSAEAEASGDTRSIRTLLGIAEDDQDASHVIEMGYPGASGETSEVFCVAVDAIVGNRPLMVMPVGALLAKARYFAGVGIMENGGISVLLDTEKILWAASQRDEK